MSGAWDKTKSFASGESIGRMRAVGLPCRVTTTGVLPSSIPLRISVARFFSSLIPTAIVATIVGSYHVARKGRGE